MAEYGITNFAGEDALYIRQPNCATMLSLERSEYTDYWQVCATDYEHSISLAVYATYEEAKVFRDKLAEFIDKNVSRHVGGN